MIQIKKITFSTRGHQFSRSQTRQRDSNVHRLVNNFQDVEQPNFKALLECSRLLALRLSIFIVGLRDKARYQRRHSAHYRGFKLATLSFVLSIVNVDVRHFKIFFSSSGSAIIRDSCLDFCSKLE